MQNNNLPTVFIHDVYNAQFSIKLKNLSNAKAAIDHIESVYHSVFPEDPFEYYFLDDQFNDQYQSDLQFGNLFSAFSLAAIFTSLIGLYALVSFSATMRVQEIGVRKILGASPTDLIILLSKEYVLLLLTAYAVSIPLLLIWSDSWLDSYAFKTPIGVDLFLLPFLLVTAISLLTVTFQAYKFACLNPAKALTFQ